MTADDMTAAGVDDLVSAYADAAAAHLRATAAGDDDEANRRHDVVAAVYRELRRRDERQALLPLLRDDDAGVRLWAGAHALEFAPADGEPVLERLAAEDGFGAFDAEMTLETWRAGDLRFP